MSKTLPYPVSPVALVCFLRMGQANSKWADGETVAQKAADALEATLSDQQREWVKLRLALIETMKREGLNA